MINAQRAVPVNTARMARVARCAIRRLRIRSAGTIAVTFIDARRMRTLNRRFRRHDWVTDVLSFRYDREPAVAPGGVVGEILIAPSEAQAYATHHGVSYTEELSRYVVHGLLHWLGHDDRTKAQQAAMRAREDQLLS